MKSILLFLFFTGMSAVALPTPDPDEQILGLNAPDQSLSTSITIGEHTFVNKGLVAFGLIPSNAKDKFGETIGGIGSSIAIQRGTFQVHGNGTFTGKLYVQPDRGYNVEAPIDWQTRIHELAFTLKPYYGTKHLSFEEAQRTLQLQYLSTTLQTFQNQPTSGADPTAFEGSSNIQYPVVSANYTRLTVDPEGLVQNAATFTEDGGPSFWVSDEYGPYIHLLSKDGTVLKTIVPPDAVLPRNRNGQLDFTSLVDPVTGRCANQGFEGLTTSASGDKLYAFLQSALKQDGGGDRKTNRYTRLFMWDISAGAAGNATLEAEWIVPLPQSNKLETFAQSEIHWLNEHQFLVLARDGKGAGDDKPESSYKGVDVIDISSATNIANSVYDGATGAVTPGGQIVANVTPVTYTPFVQMIDKTQLSRFGLHNGKPADKTLIAAKWESLALVPVGDALYPDDYFLFTFADNDFQTKDGVSMGKPYTAGVDVDNQAMVWRVELPTVQRGSVETLIGV